jgi:hypothetical protein
VVIITVWSAKFQPLCKLYQPDSAIVAGSFFPLSCSYTTSACATRLSIICLPGDPLLLLMPTLRPTVRELMLPRSSPQPMTSGNHYINTSTKLLPWRELLGMYSTLRARDSPAGYSPDILCVSCLDHRASPSYWSPLTHKQTIHHESSFWRNNPDPNWEH